MRNLLLLALFFYNVIGWINGIDNGKDYDEYNNKRHAIMDERKNRRKKALLNEEDGHDVNFRTHDLYELNHIDDADRRINDREAERPDSNYKTYRRYDGNDDFSYPPPKSGERYDDNNKLTRKSDMEIKGPQRLNCDRIHERYESCFAGCASVTCDNPRERLRPCYPFCEQGCICVPPYVRDDRTHKCVLPENCTKGLKGIPDLGGDN